VPTISSNDLGEMVGTLRFAHPTNHAAIALSAVAADA